MSKPNPPDREPRAENPFELLLQAASEAPKAAPSRAVRGLSAIVPASALVAFLALAMSYWPPTGLMIWLARIAWILFALSLILLTSFVAIQALRDLSDVQKVFLAHLSRCHPGETAAIESLSRHFTLAGLEDAEARIVVTIAQSRARIPLIVPIDKLATPAAVALAYFVTPNLVGVHQDGAPWPAWLFAALLGLSMIAWTSHQGAEALERSALLLQRAIVRKRQGTDDLK